MLIGSLVLLSESITTKIIDTPLWELRVLAGRIDLQEKKSEMTKKSFQLSKRLFATIAITALLLPCLALAQDPIPSDGALRGVYKKRTTYSPYAARNFPTRVFWGDTHLHTGMSMDAGAFGARLEPEDAQRFARGEQVTSSTGQLVKLSRPLDFLVVADHSDQMGFFPRLISGEPSMLADPTCRSRSSASATAATSTIEHSALDSPNFGARADS